MTNAPTFYGIGVGPGPTGLIPIAAVRALQEADVIVIPRARKSETSVAHTCIADLGLPTEKFHEIVFSMETERAQALQVYEQAAQEIAQYIRNGKTVAYLTIGDSMTFSTYGYLLAAIKEIMPELHCHTFPGITSYAAIASAVGWTLGQGKERVLILPCPETAAELESELRTHDLVVLMKIGHRINMVHSVLHRSAEFECAIGQRIGLADEMLSTDLDNFIEQGGGGYLTTIIIRRKQGANECACQKTKAD